jgi:signal transduction histidine kinase
MLEPLSFMYDFFRPEAEKKGLELFINCPDIVEPTIIYTDKEKVYAVLTNLIKNAIKFTEQGSITFGYLIKDEMLEFYVKDTGIGIPEAKQGAVFNRFIQVDNSLSSGYEGSGLGLAISKAYIEMLGGSISVQSEIGKGTTFYFLLPNKKSSDIEKANN